MMNKTALLPLALALLALPCLAQKSKKEPVAPPAPSLPPLPPVQGPKKRLAVGPLEVKVQTVQVSVPSISQPGQLTNAVVQIQASELGTGLSDMLATALVSADRFVLLDRLNLEDIIKERNLGQAPGATPEMVETSSVVASKLLGAQVMIRGAVTELAFKKSSNTLGGALGKLAEGVEDKSDAMAAIDLKLVDIGTGQILDSIRAEGHVETKVKSLRLSLGDFKMGRDSLNSSPLGQAARKAIIEGVRLICERMEKIPWQGKVARVVGEGDSAILYLSAGREAGLKEGDILELYRPGETIIDPDTKLVLGQIEGKVVGKCRITRILDKNLSTAKVTEGTLPEVGDQVRFLAPQKVLP
ncbi:CsgG/HfaB family protein [Armatimonas rosea]|uniref:Curli biogenesis system outer membrane secretion channel CsgG n=1 Tax=Armatimonas rosea TaxID=685828 RepID=A0A7W9SLA5_ARMRO|nr:CsgG/HfaB family protein [Armatimonas rosea]MBB6048415.1 curli biogenesis system outer membrane secretion channel CsgG [Armatimonas rosea]